MDDIVIDTNVFAHASNPESGFFICSSSLLEAIESSDVVLAVDEFFFEIEAENTSGIYSEYIANLNGCDLAQSVLATLIDHRRIKSLSTTVSNQHRAIINQGVPDPTDRKFLKVTTNSIEKVLVSNDINDFKPKFRKLSEKRLGVKIDTSTEALVYF